MSKPKITKDVKSNAQIDDLKVKRNAGELTTEVVQMCCDQLDEMAKVAVECVGKNAKRVAWSMLLRAALRCLLKSASSRIPMKR